MNNLPKQLKDELSADPEYSRCAIPGGGHQGRITFEHALYFKGKQVQERFAIVPVCAAHHGVDWWQDAPTESPKSVRVWIALNRATDEELFSISKVVNYHRERDRLNALYGKYEPPPIPERIASFVSRPIRSVQNRTTMNEADREIRALARTNGWSTEYAREVFESFA